METEQNNIHFMHWGGEVVGILKNIMKKICVWWDCIEKLSFKRQWLESVQGFYFLKWQKIN